MVRRTILIYLMLDADLQNLFEYWNIKHGGHMFDVNESERVGNQGETIVRQWWSIIGCVVERC